MAVELSIVVPTYKEQENLPLLLEEIRTALEESPMRYEVVVVDDNSPDETVAVCAKLVAAGHPLRLIVRQTERGLSSAVIRGFEEATGEWIACMDADLSHPPSVLPAMIRELRQGRAQLVIGSRYVPGGSTDAAWGVFRWLNSKVATLLSTPFSGGARDPMAGFFMMSRSVYGQKDPLNPIGYKILLEIICKCRLQRVAEVPIHFRDRRFGQSKLNLREQVRYVNHLYRLYEYKYTFFYQFTHFCMVGASGMIIDLTVMHVAYHLLGATFPMARAWGIGVALLWNFVLNRMYTFLDARSEHPVVQFFKFALACSVGAGINLALSVWAFNGLYFFQGRMARCAVLGIAAGTVSNFLLCKYFAFRHGKLKPVPIVIS